MATKKQSGTRGWIPSWLRHRSLIVAEASLLVGAAKDAATRRLTPELPGWGRVLVTMALTVGFLGGVIYLARGLAAKGVARTHDVVKAVPLPAPTLLMHLAIFAALYLLYAHQMGVDPWPAGVGPSR